MATPNAVTSAPIADDRMFVEADLGGENSRHMRRKDALIKQLSAFRIGTNFRAGPATLKKLTALW
jgi:hypothetical protein